MRPKSGKPSFELIIIYFQIVFISLVEICGYNSYFSVLFKTIMKDKLSERSLHSKKRKIYDPNVKSQKTRHLSSFETVHFRS